MTPENGHPKQTIDSGWRLKTTKFSSVHFPESTPKKPPILPNPIKSGYNCNYIENDYKFPGSRELRRGNFQALTTIIYRRKWIDRTARMRRRQWKSSSIDQFEKIEGSGNPNPNPNPRFWQQGNGRKPRCYSTLAQPTLKRIQRGDSVRLTGLVRFRLWQPVRTFHVDEGDG